MQKQVKKDNDLQITEQNWAEAVSVVRNHAQNNRIEAIIHDIEIRDATAYITLTVPSIDHEFICTLDAAVTNNNISELEQFIKNQGYNPTEKNITDRLIGQTCTVRLKATNQKLTLNINPNRETEIQPNRGSNTKLNIQLSHIKNVETFLYFSAGYILGYIPLLNLLSTFILSRKLSDHPTGTDRATNLTFLLIGLFTSLIITTIILLLI